MLVVIGGVLLWSGVFFMIVTAVGMLRLPDFYARLHAVSKTETLGLVLVMLGLGLNGLSDGQRLLLVKLLLAALFILLSSPTSAHLLARAAARLGQQPWTRTASILGRRSDPEDGEDG